MGFKKNMEQQKQAQVMAGAGEKENIEAAMGEPMQTKIQNNTQ